MLSPLLRHSIFICVLQLLYGCANVPPSDLAIESASAPQSEPLLVSLGKDRERMNLISSPQASPSFVPAPAKGPPAELTAYMRALVDKIASRSPWPTRRIVTIVADCPVFTDEMQDDGVLRFCVSTLRHLGSESEIAFIAAHEVSHVVLRHTMGDDARLAEQTSVTKSNYWHGGPPGRTTAETNAANTNAQIKRVQEQEADYLGVDLMVRAGFNPNGAYTFFDLKRRSRLAKGSYRDKNEAAQKARIDKSIREMKDTSDIGVVAAQATFNAIDSAILTGLHDDDHKSAEVRMTTIAVYVRQFYQIETARPLGKPGWKTQSVKFKETARLFASASAD